MVFPGIRICICLLFSVTIWAQTPTKVTVFDINMTDDELKVSNAVEVPGEGAYNNQPFFRDNTTILLSAERDSQTDILKYDLHSKKKTWISATPGGEYSPQPIPDSDAVAAVRLDPDGLQRLYKYNEKRQEISEMISDLPVAYFSFRTARTIIATVLNGDKMDLVSIDLHLKKISPLFTDAGRGIQKIPKSESISYTLTNEAGKWDIYVMEQNVEDTYFVTELPYEIQDYVWLNDTQILIGMQSKLYLYDTFGEGEWTHIANLEDFGLKNISRMAVSPDGKKLAVVSE